MVRKHPLLSACALAALIGIALGHGDVLAGALASAAGTAFEAAPFLLFAEAVGPRAGALAGLAGCGCARSTVPGALGIPAIVLCALSFGPLAALVRAAAGLGLLTFGRGRSHAGGRDDSHGRLNAPHVRPTDLFADLETLAASAFLAAIAAAFLTRLSSELPRPVAFAAGLGLGAIAPCATAGVALATAFARSDPALAVGILCTTGLVSVPLAFARATRDPERHARIATIALVLALAWIAMRGPSGLVSPRLSLPIGLGALAGACVLGRLRTRTPASALVPALMLGALFVVPRPPTYRAEATRLDDAFAGERLAFTGLAHVDASGRATLTRFAITCCRIDATPVSVRLDRPFAAFEGRWVDANGTLARAANGALELRTERARTVAAPADPFIYK